MLDVTSSPSVAPSATLTIGISDPDLFNPQVNGSFSLSPGLSGSLTFASTAGFDCSASANLATVPIGDFCTEIGCFTVNLLADAQAGGSVGEAFSETIGDTLSGSAGASFAFGATTPSFNTFDHLHLVPTASQSPPGWQGSISAGIGPAIQVLYGIPDVGGVGPQLGLLDEVSLSGNASGWSLHGGVIGTAGIALDALGYSFEQGVDLSLGSATLLSGSPSPSPTAPLEPTVTGGRPDEPHHVLAEANVAGGERPERLHGLRHPRRGYQPAGDDDRSGLGDERHRGRPVGSHVLHGRNRCQLVRLYGSGCDDLGHDRGPDPAGTTGSHRGQQWGLRLRRDAGRHRDGGAAPERRRERHRRLHHRLVRQRNLGDRRGACQPARQQHRHARAQHGDGDPDHRPRRAHGRHRERLGGQDPGLLRGAGLRRWLADHPLRGRLGRCGEREVVDARTAASASFSIPEGGVPYRLVVLADDAAGLSPSSAEVTVTPSGPPGPPAGLTVVLVKGLERTYQASWSAPADQGGAPVSGYQYCWSAGAQRSCGQLGANTTTLPIAFSSPGGNNFRLVLGVSIRAITSFGAGLPAVVALPVFSNPLPGPGPGPGPGTRQKALTSGTDGERRARPTSPEGRET